MLLLSNVAVKVNALMYKAAHAGLIFVPFTHFVENSMVCSKSPALCLANVRVALLTILYQNKTSF